MLVLKNLENTLKAKSTFFILKILWFKILFVYACAHYSYFTLI